MTEPIKMPGIQLRNADGNIFLYDLFHKRTAIMPPTICPYCNRPMLINHGVELAKLRKPASPAQRAAARLNIRKAIAARIEAVRNRNQGHT